MTQPVVGKAMFQRDLGLYSRYYLDILAANQFLSMEKNKKEGTLLPQLQIITTAQK